MRTIKVYHTGSYTHIVEIREGTVKEIISLTDEERMEVATALATKTDIR